MQAPEQPDQPEIKATMVSMEPRVRQGQQERLDPRVPPVLARLALLELAPPEQRVLERPDLLVQLDKMDLRGHLAPAEFWARQASLAQRDRRASPAPWGPLDQRVLQVVTEQLARQELLDRQARQALSALLDQQALQARQAQRVRREAKALKVPQATQVLPAPPDQPAPKD